MNAARNDNAPTRPSLIQRPGASIVLSLRATSNADPCIRAAIALATATHTEIIGICLRESAMFDVAELPFSKAFNVGAATPTVLTAESMNRAFARKVEDLRRKLAERAGEAQIRWSFNTLEGDAPVAIHGTLKSSDLLVITADAVGFGTKALIHELRSAPKNLRGVMVAAGSGAPKGPVIAIDDGDVAGAETVALAARIAQASNFPLIVFALAGSADTAELIEQRAQELTGQELPESIYRFQPGAPGAVAEGIMRLNPSFVVGDLEGEPFSDDASAQLLFRAARAPVVLLRPIKSVQQESSS